MNRNRLTSDRRSINTAITFYDNTVQRDSVARTNKDNIINAGIFRRNHTDLVAFYQIYSLRTHIDRIHDLRTAALYCLFFKIFTDTIEQHNTDCFRVRFDGKCTKGCHTHQKILVKDLSFGQVAECGKYHFPAKNCIGNYISGKHQRTCISYVLQNFHNNEENSTDDDGESSLRLFGHAGLLFFCCFRTGTFLFADRYIRLHGNTYLTDLRKDTIRILRRDAKLLGSKCKNCLVHFIHLIDPTLQLGCTVRAVQTFDDIGLGTDAACRLIFQNDLNFGLDRRTDLLNLRKQGIIIFSGDTKLFGCISNGSFCYARKFIDPGFHLGSAVGTTKVLKNIYTFSVSLRNIMVVMFVLLMIVIMSATTAAFVIVMMMPMLLMIVIMSAATAAFVIVVMMVVMIMTFVIMSAATAAFVIVMVMMLMLLMVAIMSTAAFVIVMVMMLMLLMVVIMSTAAFVIVMMVMLMLLVIVPTTTATFVILVEK